MHRHDDTRSDRPGGDDFDHTHPAYNADAPAVWADLRSRCPVARSERFGGVWLPTREVDIRTVAYDPATFSSKGLLVSNLRPGPQTPPAGDAPPITADPPYHQPMRRLLLPAFAPKAIERLVPSIEATCSELLDTVAATSAATGSVDIATVYASHVPVRTIATMLGLPEDEGDRFRHFVAVVFGDVDVDPSTRLSALGELTDYVTGHVHARASRPTDDLIGHLAGCTVDGRALRTEEIVGMVLLLLVAGIDTTWSTIGSALLHLATHPQDRGRLATHPELWPTAVEEFLRAFAPVTTARIVMSDDATIGGRTCRRDDWVLLAYPAANRDPAAFIDPDTVRIDRVENRHVAFGVGIHRCLGSNLARVELTVALRAFLERFPHFQLADVDEPVRWSTGQVRGPRRLVVEV